MIWIVYLNVWGWIKLNVGFRKEIVNFLNCDIISVNEILVDLEEIYVIKVIFEMVN